MNRKSRLRRSNPVAKFNLALNRPQVFEDKKRELKKGYQKHKSKYQGDVEEKFISFSPTCS